MNYSICKVNNEGIEQEIYWNQEDGILYTDYDDTEAYGVSLDTLAEALEAADALWAGMAPEWTVEPDAVDNAANITKAERA